MLDLNLTDTIASIVCSLISGLASYFAARIASKNDIKKLKLELAHQDRVEEEQQFNEMCQLVYAQANNFISTDPAVGAAVAIVRSKASGAYADALDELLSILRTGQKIRIPPAIQKVIDERSKIVSKK